MGFFDLKVECAICDKEVGLNRYQIKDKLWICPECFKKCGFSMATPIRKMTVNDIKAAMESKNKNDEEFNKFNATKKFGTLIWFDESQKKWLIPEGIFGKVKNPKIRDYNDIIDFELLENGEIITKGGGGLGRAIAGGVLFGGVGAIVGGVTGKKKTKSTGICKSLKIKITVNDIENPAAYINILNSEAKKDSLIYKNLYGKAQEILSTLQVICNNQDREVSEINNNAVQISSADEILKFKNLLDSGIITQEEFEAKKKQLLGL